MDEKTEHLREVFTSVTDAEEVTEEQAETRGSLTGGRSGDLADVVGELRGQYDFETDCDTETYCELARAFYEAVDSGEGAADESGGGGVDDAAVADAVGLDAATARRARFDLHLYVDADLDPAFDADRARELLADAAPAAVAAELDADEAAVERFAAADAARDRSLRANQRFRRQFDELLADGDLRSRLASEVREDGLEEATEGMETDVEF
jgi:hypothetical protein